jgi:hypothetical protein
LRDRFGVAGFPTIYYIHGGQMYAYKGARTVEAWEAFTSAGFKEVEAEEFPLEYSMVKSMKKQGDMIWKQVQMLYREQPYVFGGVIGVMVLLCGLTFWCSSRIDEPREEAVGQEDDKRGRLNTTDETRAQRTEDSKDGKEGSVKASRTNKPKQE